MALRRIIYGLLVGVALWRAFGLIAQAAPPPFLPAAWQAEPSNKVVWVWGEVDSLTRPGPQGLRLAMKLRGRWRSGVGAEPQEAIALPPIRVWVNWPLSMAQQQQMRVTPGEVWALPLRWRRAPAPHPTRSGEAGFDTWRWMQVQGLSALATVAVPVGQAARLVQAPPGMARLRQQVREAIFAQVSDPRLAGLVAALCMGDQNAIDPDDWPLFRATGVAHLVSISGLHVTLLAGWLAAGVQWAWCRASWARRAWALRCPAPWVASWVALAVATGYAVFAGWGLPAQRTVWMLMAVMALRLAGLHAPVHAVWLALIGGVALLDPLALSQPGFWLSYVAVGLLYGMGEAPRGSALRRWWHEAVAQQWRISLALAPMGMYFFQGISWAGLWVNVGAIPWVTLVVTPLSLLGLVCPPLWEWAAWAGGWLLWALEWAAQSPWALTQVPAPALGVVVLSTGLAVWAAWPGPLKRRLLCAAAGLGLLAWP